jgi:hypothetical protein
MRKREEIENDGLKTDLIIKELLLDIRELLAKKTRKPRKTK